MNARTLNKLLKEFPWLWAIKQNWDPRQVEICVSKAQPELLLRWRVVPGDAYQSWMIHRLGSQLIATRLVTEGQRWTNVAVASSRLRAADEVFYLVHLHKIGGNCRSEDYFTIYKSPRHTSYLELLQMVADKARSNEEPPQISILRY